MQKLNEKASTQVLFPFFQEKPDFSLPLRVHKERCSCQRDVPEWKPQSQVKEPIGDQTLCINPTPNQATSYKGCHNITTMDQCSEETTTCHDPHFAIPALGRWSQGKKRKEEKKREKKEN